jgi:cytolysin-activating lysine-acyltransferase
MTPETFQQSRPGLLASLPAHKRNALIGEIVGLFLASPLHRRLYLKEVGANILPPLNLNQFRVYRKGAQCVGYVSWAYLTEEIEARYRTGNYGLLPEDWNAGDRRWFIDFVAPFGHTKMMVRELRTKIFPNEKFRSFRVRVDGKRNGERLLRGISAGASE